MVRTYPHIDDLVASASEPQVTPNMSLHAMLKRAEESLTRAEADLGFARPDHAYVEYLKACNIILHIAPRHREYKIASTDRYDAWKLNKDLQARIQLKHDKFAAIKEQIKQNNAQSGVQSAHLLQANGASPSKAPQNGSASPPSKPQELTVRKKPTIQPKPANLTAKKVLPNVPDDIPAVDPLAERFANLRSSNTSKKVAEQESRPGSAGSINANYSTSTTSVPEYTPTSSVSSEHELAKVISGPTILQTKPAGPREMPPPRPAKIPLETNLPDLPKPPSPTYSPARSGPDLPNLITRSSSRQIASTTSLNEALNGQSNSTYSAPASSAPVARLNAQPINLPRRTEITPEQLVEYLKADRSQLELLLVDLRSREEFDEGHIHARNIMCIEPIILELDMATPQLEERLVMSPENEQALFARRHEFDLVIFYDQSTETNHYLGGPSRSRDEQVLRAFTQAFYEFNFDKPLQRPPVLLKGGLDAWIDLMGVHSLKINTKPNQPRRVPQRPVRPGIRLVSETSSLILKGRQNRLDSPLNQEEKELWLDRVRGDGEGLHLRMPQGDLDSKASRRLASIVPVDNQTNVVRSYDDFLRRFPSPEDIKQSMVAPMSSTPRSPSGTVIDNHYHNFTNVSPPQDDSLHATPLRPPPAVPRKSYSGVSERVTRPPPTEHVIPPSMHPERPSTNDTITAATELMYGRTGLRNLGNTCYMNSVIQCLSATAPLSRFFLDGSYKRDLTRENKLGSNGVLPEIYANVVSHLWQGQYNHISPKTFREFVGRLNPDLRTDRQQDANDFLVFLIDTLHEDLNVNFRKTRLKELSPDEERSRESLPPQIASRIEWDRWSHNNYSRIASLFAGQHTSRLQCMTCGFKSTSYETFYSIPLEIPAKGKASVYDCLKNYTKEERLDKDNNWRCPSCKTIRETTKKITITRAPQILVIQFKRFKTSSDGWMDKVKTPISFPLSGLDITPFVAPPLHLSENHTPQADAIRRLQAQHNHQPDFATMPPFKYDVYGVVNHFGSLSGGHYKAVVRNGVKNQWVEFDDSRCSDFSPSKVVDEAAYLLFCVRPNPF